MRKFSVNLDTDFRDLKTHVFKTFNDYDSAISWWQDLENRKVMRSYAIKQRILKGIFSPVRRRINVTAYGQDFGRDVAYSYFLA